MLWRAKEREEELRHEGRRVARLVPLRRWRIGLIHRGKRRLWRREWRDKVFCRYGVCEARKALVSKDSRDIGARDTQKDREERREGMTMAVDEPSALLRRQAAKEVRVCVLSSGGGRQLTEDKEQAQTRQQAWAIFQQPSEVRYTGGEGRGQRKARRLSLVLIRGESDGGEEQEEAVVEGRPSRTQEKTRPGEADRRRHGRGGRCSLGGQAKGKARELS